MVNPGPIQVKTRAAPGMLGRFSRFDSTVGTSIPTSIYLVFEIGIQIPSCTYLFFIPQEDVCKRHWASKKRSNGFFERTHRWKSQTTIGIEEALAQHRALKGETASPGAWIYLIEQSVTRSDTYGLPFVLSVMRITESRVKISAEISIQS